MSKIVSTGLICDVCGDVSDHVPEGDGVKYLRERAKRDGWIYKNREDFCDSCVAAGNHKTGGNQ